MNKRVAVSLGHYPSAPGAVCPSGKYANLTEYTLDAPIVGLIIKELQYRGIDAFLVPTGHLTTKVNYINSKGFDFAIEMHLNADPDSDSVGTSEARGCETLYNVGSTKGEQFAKSIQGKLISGLPLTNRGVKPRSDLAFLRDTSCPAVIVEPAFIDDVGADGTSELNTIMENHVLLASLIAEAIHIVFNTI